ncbi:MAG: hypothetical protein A2826_00220 [Candidatus Doudnabacteria bacterium RIFCSPHIGHO2_01_FULL_43_23]|uniref:Uncharacterized protein n=1 Tax=Candidatus Doudnabacteria bacterium RIFCSPHIGHO2_01_FULL_43_23 TaxID=1817822 RepID=A0A1F5NTF3_9BACT|nr:MAG: hypothetical protein A2826_00220 [Candidatus Doudnabacteria bacterium RIFCSPHIGHO2_01_FULL_43_23]
MREIIATLLPHPERRVYNLETALVGTLGIVFILMRDLLHHWSVVEETIVLVIFLAGLMGITRIPFVSTFRGKPLPLWAYPLVSGFISGFMDSFLVLLLIGKAKLEGPKQDQFKFKAINMIAALIGGLITYFGEVYMLPLALKYNMREWHSMLPVIPPVAVFLLILGFLTNRLAIKIIGVELADNNHGKKMVADKGDYLEFAVAVAILLFTHNALLCLGVLFFYSFVTGQGEDLIEVMKTETEVAVMTLLVVAAFIAEPVAPLMSNFEGYKAFFPAVVNGVLTGAIYPAAGNIWQEVPILSTAVLITPLSSLVGVMLFKTRREWWDYMRLSVPIAMIWFGLCWSWFHLLWPYIDPHFYQFFTRPMMP